MYYPIMRWKASEKVAIQNIGAEWRDQLTPVWMLNEHQQLEQIQGELGALWQGQHMLDVSRVQSIKDVEPSLLTIIKTMPVRLVMLPVQFESLDANLAIEFSRAPVFRIALDAKGAFEQKFHDFALDTLSPFISNADDVFILFDLHNIDESIFSIVDSVVSIVSRYVEAGFRNLILAGGSFPLTITDIVGTKMLPRVERIMYEKVFNASGLSNIKYSDYTTISPLWKQQSGGRGPYANIRYAMDYEWLIQRDDQRGSSASIALAQILVNSIEYRGENFSWADRIWYNRAKTSTKPGNPQNHVAEAINHHIAQVLNHG